MSWKKRERKKNEISRKEINREDLKRIKKNKFLSGEKEFEGRGVGEGVVFLSGFQSLLLRLRDFLEDFTLTEFSSDSLGSL